MSQESRQTAAATELAEALEELLAGREETLAMVADLDQAQLDAVPDPGRWSVGEILDHLIRADDMFTREIRALAEKREQGRTPIVIRSLRQIGAPLSWLPLPIRLPFEFGLMGWNMAVPPVLREWIMGQRRLRVEASEILRPKAGRGGQLLRADLGLGVGEIERLVTDVDLAGAVYYSPIAGFNNITGLLRLIHRHEQRHQEQLREALASLAS